MAATEHLFTDGAAYERLMGRWSRRAGAEFLGWLAPPGGLHWLDVGCGNGAFTEELMARCAPAAMTAIDPSEEQLAYARTRPGIGLAQFQKGDAQNLPFATASFDAAVMALVIAFVPDAGKAVAEMVRVVRPGGLVSAYMWDLRRGGVPTSPLAAAARSLGLSPPMPPNVEASRLEAMQEMWQQAGLLSVETTTLTIPVSFASFDDFWESNTQPSGPTGTMIASLPDETREAIRGLLRGQMLPGPDGRITYEARANAVKGRVRG